VVSGTYWNFTFGSTASSVFSWDADQDALKTTLNGEICYMGTYGSYVTMGVLRESKLKDTDYIARLYMMGASQSECEHKEWTEATCEKLSTCLGCGKTRGELAAHNYVSGSCSVCGAVDPNAGGAGTTTVKVVIADYADANGWTNSAQYPDLKMDDVVMVTARGGQNTGKYYTSGEQWRMYQTESPSIEVSGGDKTIVSVKITYVQNNNGVLTYNGTNIASGTVVEANATSATFGVGNSGSATNGQVRITAIEVTYASGNSGSETECAHDEWDAATCEAPKTCSKCGETVGQRVPHNYVDGVCTVCEKPDPRVPSESWTKVTNVSDLKAGDKIVIVANTTAKALSTTQNKNNRGAAGVTKSGNTVTFDSDVQIIELVTGTVSGTFGFKVGTQYLYAASSSSNYLRSGSLNDNASWKITIESSGVATVKAQGSNTRNLLRYNNANNLFACYSSGQQDIAIYKLTVTTGECPHDWVDATCQLPKICLDCKATEGEALGHSWDDATCTAPKTCSVCYETEGEALGHDWDDATCELPKTCSVCSATEGEALGHDWDDATCTAPKTCSVCGDTEGEALGHNYTSEVTTDPTCEKDGVRTHTCGVCGDDYTTVIRRLGHSVVNGTCETCGDIFFLPEVKDPAETCGGAFGCPLHLFSDLDNSAWYHTGVHYCVEHGLLKGMPDNTFAPNAETTRAQIVTILWRMEGSPVVSTSVSFDDVATGEWYTDAIRWAASLNIVGGYGDGSFGTDDAITREQLAAILYRYAKYKGLDVSAGVSTNLDSFADEQTVNGYAIYALQWACGEGLIQGIGDNGALNLQPAGSATRAQVATILYRYCENVAK